MDSDDICGMAILWDKLHKSISDGDADVAVWRVEYGPTTGRQFDLVKELILPRNSKEHQGKHILISLLYSSA